MDAEERNEIKIENMEREGVTTTEKRDNRENKRRN